MLVAQYWDDNATDEVSAELLFSELETPDLTAGDAWYASFPDPVNRPHTNVRNVDVYVAPGNPELIPLFAAYCREGATQDDEPRDSFSVYAVFRRTDLGVHTEVVGVQRRPWLDGRRIDG
jgi:hypothetical protein